MELHRILTSSFASRTAVIATYVFFVSTMLSIGLTVRADEIRGALRNRGLLARVLVANVILVPILGMVLVKLFPLSADARTAILLLAFVPGGTQAIQFTAKIGKNIALAAALLFLLSLAGIVVSPLLAALILPVETGVTIPWQHAVGFIVLFLLLPLLAGFALGRGATQVAGALQKPMLLISNISFVLTIVFTLGLRRKAAGSIGWAALTAMALLILLSMAIGWRLGGPDKSARQVSAIATSMRNAGLCLLVAAASFPGRNVQTATVAFMALMVPPNMLFTACQRLRGGRGQT
ncbi:MAG: bile acid:sodium symporter [Syntrophobacteraceae bacterium]|nr:bile acid:sodium symporter [Syntrophobacteraceae bacterium]